MTGAEWFTSGPGGLNRYFTDLFSTLNQLPGVDVSAAAFGKPERGGRSWGPVGASTLSRAYTAFRDTSALPPDAVIDRHFCLYGRSAIGAHGKHPLVVHFHGPWAAESRMVGAGEMVARSKYWIERLRYAGADRFVVLSKHFRNLLVDSYQVPEGKIRVIPPGVDLDRFRPSDSPSASCTILCVRRLERRMGIHVLLRSWRAVIAAHPDARLVIVGTGTEESALRVQAAEAGYRDSITFEGNATDGRLAQLYGQAALTIVPSVALEGFGLIALESLAAGRAPIVTECGGLPDSVQELDPSLIVPTGDADALGDRIVRALDGQVPGPEQCRAHAETFSWDAASQQHISMYEELVS
ncbi:glycosyltransferase family 4 protein [Rhodococcus sp. NPDC059968]|uniref:glycosyltransferase family 4 protein n=1 Tax=Rhodococcus sp. NPDC059968 TaxID=3347017 RepID=UPI00366AE58C